MGRDDLFVGSGTCRGVNLFDSWSLLSDVSEFSRLGILIHCTVYNENRDNRIFYFPSLLRTNQRENLQGYSYFMGKGYLKFCLSK